MQSMYGLAMLRNLACVLFTLINSRLDWAFNWPVVYRRSWPTRQRATSCRDWKWSRRQNAWTRRSATWRSWPTPWGSIPRTPSLSSSARPRRRRLPRRHANTGTAQVQPWTFNMWSSYINGHSTAVGHSPLMGLILIILCKYSCNIMMIPNFICYLLHGGCFKCCRLLMLYLGMNIWHNTCTTESNQECLYVGTNIWHNTTEKNQERISKAWKCSDLDQCNKSSCVLKSSNDGSLIKLLYFREEMMAKMQAELEAQKAALREEEERKKEQMNGQVR